MAVTVLDAGFSTQLAKNVSEPIDGHPLWTARFLKTDRQSVVRTHQDYIEAGCDIIRTNTYQATVEGFLEHYKMTHDEAIQLIQDGVRLAESAVDIESKKSVKGDNKKIEIVGSIGPYGAFLHDGSEYTGSYMSSMSVEQLKDWHRPRLAALFDAGVRLFAFETIPCGSEAMALVELLREFPSAKAWVSFSTQDSERTCSGEPFAETCRDCWAKSKQLVAMGTNCCDPSHTVSLLTRLSNLQSDIPIVVYPNSGEQYDGILKVWHKSGDLKPISSFVDDWLKLGAKFVGGCCRTNADDVRLIRARVDELIKSKK